MLQSAATVATQQSREALGAIMAYVFLSHAHGDKPFARRLAADLRNAGHSVWIDEGEINIGDSLVTKIRDGLDQVDYVCAIISKTSVESAWVEKELEIASNREIDERRVVVLPLLVDDVPLPGFLRGKFYGDFRSAQQYGEKLELLLRSLGPSQQVAVPSAGELHELKERLAAALTVAKQHENEAKRASDAAFRAKSETLKAAIETANRTFPGHAPINRTYAFEAGTAVTLDYALWAIAKSKHRGSHPLEVLLTIEDKWGDMTNMLEAYQEMLDRQTPERS
jgi:hypothetical protein